MSVSFAAVWACAHGTHAWRTVWDYHHGGQWRICRRCGTQDGTACPQCSTPAAVVHVNPRCQDAAHCQPHGATGPVFYDAPPTAPPPPSGPAQPRGALLSAPDLVDARAYFEVQGDWYGLKLVAQDTAWRQLVGELLAAIELVGEQVRHVEPGARETCPRCRLDEAYRRVQAALGGDGWAARVPAVAEPLAPLVRELLAALPRVVVQHIYSLAVAQQHVVAIYDAVAAAVAAPREDG